MSRQDSLQGDAGGEGDTDSGVVGVDSRVITMNLYNILQNPRSPEWDAGTVDLLDGQPFELWSTVSSDPTITEGETQEAFTERLHTAQKKSEPKLLLIGRRVIRVSRDLVARRQPTLPPPSASCVL